MTNYQNNQHNSANGDNSVEEYYNLISKGVGYINTLIWHTNDDQVQSLIGRMVLLVGLKNNYQTRLYSFIAVGKCIEQLDQFYDQIQNARKQKVGVYGAYELGDPEPCSYPDENTGELIHFIRVKLIKIRYLKIGDDILVSEEADNQSVDDDNVNKSDQYFKQNNQNSRSSNQGSKYSKQNNQNSRSSTQNKKYSNQSNHNSRPSKQKENFY